MTSDLLVGVDASRAYLADPTGTETYAARVIDGLAAVTGHALRLYLRRPPLRAVPPGAQARVLPAPRLWTHTRLAWEVRRSPPDVLFVPAHVLPIGVRCPAVATVHDLGHRAHPEAHTWAQRTYLEWSTRRHARLARRLLVDSRSTADDLERHFPSCRGRVVVAPLGVDADMRPCGPEEIAAARAELGVRPNRRYVLYVGTLQPRKNLERLVTAWSLVADRWPEVDLVLAGRPGWGGHDPAAVARRLGIERRVLLPGYVPRAVLPGAYSGAVALAHPSLYEGFGLTVAEAMACGTTVLASRASSLPEVVGDAGLLFDPTDDQAIAECLQLAIEDEGLRRRLSTAGRARAALFTWTECARIVARALEEAAGR